MQMKGVLIGGGTGFVGRHLGNLLKSNGYTVTNVSRMPAADSICWNTLEAKGLPKCTKYVINCAGQQFMDPTKSWTPGFKQNVVNSRVCTVRALANAINKSKEKPDVFIAMSGVGAYSPSTTRKYDENTPVTGEDFFAQMALDIEKEAKVEPPVRKVIIRSGVVLGRWGGMVKNMFLPFFLGVGGRIGSGTQYLPWIHLEDISRLIMFALENKEVEGILNGVAPQVVTNEQFTQAFAKALGRPAIFPVPEFALNLLFNAERAMLMTKGQHVTPKRVLDYGFKYKYGKIDDACKEFAYLMSK